VTIQLIVNYVTLPAFLHEVLNAGILSTSLLVYSAWSFMGFCPTRATRLTSLGEIWPGAAAPLPPGSVQLMGVGF